MTGEIPRGQGHEFSRREFLNLSLIAGLALAACTPQEIQGMITPQNEPVPASATVSPEASSTPEVTATVEQEQHKPGTAYISPEFDLNGQIEIIPENAQAFHNYFLAALMRVNPVEAEGLKTVDGQTVFDVDATDEENVARMRTYLAENDWLVPAGWRINSGNGRFAGNVFSQLNKFDKPLNLRNLSIEIVDYEQYQEMTVYPDIKLDTGYLFFVEQMTGENVGFNLNDSEGSYTVSIQIVDTEGSPAYAFPDTGERIESGELKFLDQYATFALYVLRSFSVNPPVELVKSTSGDDTTYNYPFRIGRDRVAIAIQSLTFLFSEYHQHSPKDAPPSILR